MSSLDYYNIAGTIPFEKSENKQEIGEEIIWKELSKLDETTEQLFQIMQIQLVGLLKIRYGEDNLTCSLRHLYNEIRDFVLKKINEEHGCRKEQIETVFMYFFPNYINLAGGRMDKSSWLLELYYALEDLISCLGRTGQNFRKEAGEIISILEFLKMVYREEISPDRNKERLKITGGNSV